MKRFVYTLLLAVYCLLPIAGAASVGFAPATGLWFAKTELKPQETIAIYAVVVNNTYPAFSGTVGFYDNEEAIDTIEIDRLAKDAARLIKAAWTPETGEHRLAARFQKAYAWSESGNREPLPLSEIIGVTGAPLSVAGGAVAPAGAAALALPSPVTVAVRQQGEILVIAAPGSDSAGPSPASWFARVTKPIEGLFSRNREALNRAEEIATTVTTTAAKVSGAVAKTQATVEQGRAFYEQGKSQLARVRPYWERVAAVGRRLQPAWERLSGNNDPRRIGLLIGTIIVGYLVARWRWRRRDYDELQNY
ncbi:MAG: hypothetical protein HYV42_05300 [Candidatus Magasanikbacteria bacterium]|nr:hypothetical protein [Candidatus Magasanikbacteria bacterium]